MCRASRLVVARAILCFFECTEGFDRGFRLRDPKAYGRTNTGLKCSGVAAGVGELGSSIASFHITCGKEHEV